MKGDFRIELKERFTPVRKGLYRMSQTEPEEVKNQIGKFLEQRFIRPSISPLEAAVLVGS